MRELLVVKVASLKDDSPSVQRIYDLLENRVMVQHCLTRLETSVIEQCVGEFYDRLMMHDAAKKEKVPDPVFGIANTIDFSYRINVPDINNKSRSFILDVCEVKDTTKCILEGAPQAFLAAASAAIALRRCGLAVEDCVVPLTLDSGQTVQHGAVYLLEPLMPVYAATSSPLDVLTPAGILLAAKHYVAKQALIADTETRLRDFARHHDWPTLPATPVLPEIYAEKYFFKENVSALFGTCFAEDDMPAATSWHELSIYERLLVRGVPGTVVAYPVGRLMQTPLPSGTWRHRYTTVYDNLALQGYTAGFVRSPAWLAAVRAAVAHLHSANVVHMDLFPCNIMSKMDEATGQFSVTLIDFNASLRVGEPIPEAAPRIVSDNGCAPMYHPKFNQPSARAARHFDDWFLAAFELQIADSGFDSELWDCNPQFGTHIFLCEWFEANIASILSRLNVAAGTPRG